MNSVLQQPGRLALLVYLAMARGSAVRRDTLLGLFWPDSPEDRARHRLSQAIYHLRQSLGRDVIHGRGASGYGVSTERLWCDAAEFSAALDREDGEGALELYQGEFLPGFFCESAREFERWMEEVRTRLRRKAAGAALELAQERLPHDAVGAAATARRAMDLARFDEPTVRRVIELLSEAGDRVGALEAYESLADRLSRDFDAEPSPETVELMRSLQEAEAGREPVKMPESTGSRPREAEAAVPPSIAHRGRASRGWALGVGVVVAAVIIGLVQSQASPAGAASMPRVLVESVRSHVDSGSELDLSRAVTTETLAQLAEVAAFQVLPHDPDRAGIASTSREPSVVLRSDLARSADRVRITALLLDGESLVTIGRGTGEFPFTDDLQVVDAASAWLARFTRERAGVWMRERKLHGSGADEATLDLVRAAVADRQRADSLAKVGSAEAAGTLLNIADSVLARAEAKAPGWVEPSLQRAETALAEMWLALRWGGGEGSAEVREAVDRGLEHASRAVAIVPDDPDARALRASLTYWSWHLTPSDSAQEGFKLGRQAEERLRELVELDPTRARAWTDLSAVLQARGAFAEARWAAERAFRADAYLDRTGSLVPRLFETALETGDLDAARRWCDRIAERSGGRQAEGYCRLALLAWGPESGPEQVAKAGSILANLRPEARSSQLWGPRLDALMAVVHGRAHMLESGRQILAEATAAATDPEFAPFAAWALVHLDAADSARVVLDQYVADRPHTRTGVRESRRFENLWGAGETVGQPVQADVGQP